MLQKFGDFLQHSPTILQSKAKKIIETMSSSKFSNVEVSKENVSRPKRAKRKLYTTEISSPIDISGQVVSYYFSSLKSGNNNTYVH